jgi:hypothetical protein
MPSTRYGRTREPADTDRLLAPQPAGSALWFQHRYLAVMLSLGCVGTFSGDSHLESRRTVTERADDDAEG